MKKLSAVKANSHIRQKTFPAIWQDTENWHQAQEKALYLALIKFEIPNFKEVYSYDSFNSFNS